MATEGCRIIPIDPDAPAEDEIAQAAGWLRRGQLVILPTETVYGLAADPLIPAALDKLYEAKGRPAQKPITLLAADLAQVAAFGVRWTPEAHCLARRFFPGPLTLVLETGSGAWEGFRIPDHPVALALLRKMGRPLAVTSANRSGAPAAQTAAEAAATLGAQVALALDAGPSRGGIPSTVVKISRGRLEILRLGALPEQALLEAIAASRAGNA